MAETCRRVGRFAEELGLPRPGYDSIRLIVAEHRRNRAEILELLEPVLADFLEGRVGAWDVERLIDAATIHARQP